MTLKIRSEWGFEADFSSGVNAASVIASCIVVLLFLVLTDENDNWKIQFGANQYQNVLMVDSSIAVFIDRLAHSIKLQICDFFRQVGPKLKKASEWT